MCAGALEAEAAVQVALVSRTPTGVPANGESTVYGWGGSLSQDGSIAAFASRAANLPQGDGSTFQVYVRNIPGRTTDIASVNNSGIAATSDTFAPAISPSGDLVAFEGLGAGLPQANGNYQIWVHDTTTGKTRLVSADAKGRSGRHGLSLYPTFSGERYVAFDSVASNLPGGAPKDSRGDEPLPQQCYVRDLEQEKLVLVSKNNAGAPQNGACFDPHMSADGRYVAFYAHATNLPGGDGTTDEVYVRDRKPGKTVLLSKAAD